MAAFIRFYKKLLISLRLILETIMLFVSFFFRTRSYICVLRLRARARVCMNVYIKRKNKEQDDLCMMIAILFTKHYKIYLYSIVKYKNNNFI